MIYPTRYLALMVLGLALSFLGCQPAAEEQTAAEPPAEKVAETSAPEPAWSLQTEMVIVDSCPVACPCLFGGEPHGGQCRFVGVAHIADGSHKGVSLAGVNGGMLGEFAGKSSAPEFRYSGYYVDSEASQEQKDALRAILTNAPFSSLGEQLGIKETPIQVVG